VRTVRLRVSYVTIRPDFGEPPKAHKRATGISYFVIGLLSNLHLHLVTLRSISFACSRIGLQPRQASAATVALVQFL
jgi:hypothetical protein